MFDLPPELIQKYITRRVQDIDVLSQALKKDDIEVFQRIGHQIAGNAVNYGMDSLEKIGRNMESLKSENFKNEAKNLLDSYTAEVNKYKNIFSKV